MDYSYGPIIEGPLVELSKFQRSMRCVHYMCVLHIILVKWIVRFCKNMDALSMLNYPAATVFLNFKFIFLNP